MEQAQRIKYWDIVKGIAILLVVWGHIIQFGGGNTDIFQNKAFIFIYSFHMPLFMLVSGYFLAKSIGKRSYIENVVRKIKHIVVPAVLGGISYWAVKFVIERILGNYAYSYDIATILREIGDIWFLWSTFMCSMVVMTAKRLGGEKWFIPFLMIGFVVLFFLPYSSYNVFLFPYFLFGYFMESGKIKGIKIMELFSIVLFPIMLQYYVEKHFIYASGVSLLHTDYGVTGQISIDIFRWVIGFAGCLVIILFTKKLCEVLPESRICELIGRIGKYTLEIYLLHRIVVIYIGAKFMWKIVNGIGITFLKIENIYNYIFAPVCTIGFTLIMYWVIERVKRKCR